MNPGFHRRRLQLIHRERGAAALRQQQVGTLRRAIRAMAVCSRSPADLRWAESQFEDRRQELDQPDQMYRCPGSLCHRTLGQALCPRAELAAVARPGRYRRTGARSGLWLVQQSSHRFGVSANYPTWGSDSRCRRLTDRDYKLAGCSRGWHSRLVK